VALVEPAVRPGRSAQPDDGQQGARVDDVEAAAEPGSGVVQRRQERLLGLVPAARLGPAGAVLRPEAEAVHADRYLLLDAPPPVRQRRERDGVLQRALGPDLRLDRLEEVR